MVRELRALEGDPHLRELDSYVPSLSLLRAFGMDRGEVAHSRELACVLDPARHRNAREAPHYYVTWCPGEVQSPSSLGGR